MPSFIIVGHVRQILGRGVLFAPIHPGAAPKKPILNRVKDYICKYGYNFDDVRKNGYIRPS